MPRYTKRDVSKLVTVIESRKADGKQRIGNSKEYLANNSSLVASYKSVDSFWLENLDTGSLRPFWYHLSQLGSAIATELWSREIFVGASVLYSLIFQAIKSGAHDIVEKVLEVVFDNGLHRPGMLVYPVHSFGILAAGLFRWATKGSASLLFAVDEANLITTPQTNSDDGTLTFLESARQKFQLQQRVPRDTVEHWMRMPALKWLKYNPLIALKVHSFEGDYYENQRFFVAKLRSAASILFMLGACQEKGRDGSEDAGRLWSSGAMNNWETLDINHYAFFQHNLGEKELEGRRIPFNHSPEQLIDLCDISIDIDPRSWRRSSKLYQRIVDAVGKVEGLYLRAILGGRRASPDRIGMALKLVNSMNYFRRSYRRASMLGEAETNLAAAFELLLIETRQSDIKGSLKESAGRLFRGIRGMSRMHKRNLQQSVYDVYEARNLTLHAGSTPSVDIALSRKAFVHAFVRRIEELGL